MKTPILKLSKYHLKQKAAQQINFFFTRKFKGFVISETELRVEKNKIKEGAMFNILKVITAIIYQLSGFYRCSFSSLGRLLDYCLMKLIHERSRADKIQKL